MTGPPALRLAAVTRHHGARLVLDAVDLEVAPGETVALLGDNGAGKSTLLRIAATLARPGAGSVAVLGVDAEAHPEEARRLLGVLTQEAPLYDELSPAEHLRWWRGLRGGAGDVEASLAQAGLARVAHRPCGTLSRGQRQRAALALASLGDPPLLLLDEPFAALDGEGTRFLEALLAGRRGRAAALLALQDEAQARRIADRRVRLRGHRLEGVP